MRRDEIEEEEDEDEENEKKFDVIKNELGKTGNKLEDLELES